MKTVLFGISLWALTTAGWAQPPRAGDFAGTLRWQADWENLRERVPHYPTEAAQQRCALNLFFTGDEARPLTAKGTCRADAVCPITYEIEAQFIPPSTPGPWEITLTQTSRYTWCSRGLWLHETNGNPGGSFLWNPLTQSVTPKDGWKKSVNHLIHEATRFTARLDPSAPQPIYCSAPQSLEDPVPEAALPTETLDFRTNCAVRIENGKAIVPAVRRVDEHGVPRYFSATFGFESLAPNGLAQPRLATLPLLVLESLTPLDGPPSCTPALVNPDLTWIAPLNHRDWVGFTPATSDQGEVRFSLIYHGDTGYNVNPLPTTDPTDPVNALYARPLEHPPAEEALPLLGTLPASGVASMCLSGAGVSMVWNIVDESVDLLPRKPFLAFRLPYDVDFWMRALNEAGTACAASVIPLTRIPGAGQYVTSFSTKVTEVFERAAASLAQNPTWFRSFLSNTMYTQSRNISDLQYENLSQWQHVTSAGQFLSLAMRDFLDNAVGAGIKQALKESVDVCEWGGRPPL
jgi:hypothetical protein